MIKKMFNHQTKSSTSAGLVLALASLFSAFLGLIRNRLIAGGFDPIERDIYFAALRVPSFITTVLIMGAISVAVIPLFREYSQRSEKEGWLFLSATLNQIPLFLATLSSIFIVFAPQIISIITPGFDAPAQAEVVWLMRIMLLAPMILGLSTIISGILQCFDRFLVSAVAPIFHNIGVVLGIIVFVPWLGLAGLAWGMVLGAILHLLIQVPSFFALSSKRPPVFAWKHVGLKKLVALATPRSISVILSQANLLIVTAAASFLAVGSISIYNLAGDFSQALTRLIGVSFTTAIFPVMALSFAQRDKKRFIDNFLTSFRQIVFLVIPGSVLFFALRAQLVRLVLGTGKFSWEDTRLTAACLALFCLGIFAQALITLLSRAFGAMQDNKTPALVVLASVLLNVALIFAFIHFLGFENSFYSRVASMLRLEYINDIRIVGLPLAFSLSNIFQLFLLLLIFWRRWAEPFMKKLFIFSVKTVLASLIMAFFVYTSLYYMAGQVDMGRSWGVATQLLVATVVGGFVYLLASYKLNRPELIKIVGALKHEFKK
jgi:putative peptidoglycan lipid II flippase